MKKIIGHQKQLSILEKFIEGENLSRSIILSGASGLGKKRIAFWLAGKILQSNSLDSYNPDFLFIEPEEGSREVKIDQVRKIKEFSSLSPQESPTKVVIIDQAEELNIEAQNSLLKILEEPKNNLLIILVVSELGKIIPTVKSRCLIVKFYPVSFDVTKKELGGSISEDKLKKLFFFSRGRPGKIISLMEDKKGVDKFFAYLNQVRLFLNSSLLNKMIFSKKMFEKKIFPEKLNQFLEFVELYLLYLIAEESKREGNETGKILEMKKKIEQVEEIKNMISSTNVNKRIAFESLLIEMAN